jgi:hypothetical protein
MSERTVALYLDAWADAEGGAATLRRPLLLWRKAMWFKANPRPASYMRALLAEHWPDARIVDARLESNWAGALAGADRVVLLYPDATGIGFGRIERQVFRVASRSAIVALNGRRRVFPMDAAARRRLVLRRALERSMLIECVLGTMLLALTPLLWAFDLARGRR